MGRAAFQGRTDISRRIYPKGLLAILPPLYSVHLVRNSTGMLVLFHSSRHGVRRMFLRRHWQHSLLDTQYDLSEQHRTTIEVRDNRYRVVAAVGWKKDRTRWNARTYTIGTFVHYKLKRRGLGTELWREMFRRGKSTTIWGTAASNEGLTLLKSMQRKLGKDRVKFVSEGKLKDLAA